MKYKQIILVLLVYLLTIDKSYAFVNCQNKYDSDSRSLPSLRGNCGVCHINSGGGGPRTQFGNAFQAAGFMITNELVEKFPNLFKKPTEPTPADNGSSGSPVLDSPLIKRLKPNSVKANKETMIAIKGTNFIDGVKAFVDNNEVAATFKSNVLLIINFVFDTVGIHEVKVQNPDGTESNTVNIKVKNK